MERQELMALIANEFVKGAACTVVVNKSADSSMNKGRGVNTNPFLGGRVEIKKTYSGFVMGTDYQNSIENTAERMGNETDANLKSVWNKPIFGYLGEWFLVSRPQKFTTSMVMLPQQKSLQQSLYG